MPTETLTLTYFLLARIAEDEAQAKAASAVARSPWRWQDEFWSGKLRYGLVGDHPVQPGKTAGIVPSGIKDVYPHRDTADHITRHDPRRVLAECEAKRRIVEEHGGRQPFHVDPCDAHNANQETVPCDTIRLLALPYADHPDYRDEWRANP